MRDTRMRLISLTSVLWAGLAQATPSTTFWAPSTTYVQPYGVPHLTYDTYFWKGRGANYPVDTGFTIGVLPFRRVLLEVGYDLFLPTQNPVLFLLNAKVGTPPDTIFKESPALAVGIFGVGVQGKSDSNNGTSYEILYGQVQKTLPWGGYISAGGYYAAGTKDLWLGSDGEVHRGGFIGALMSPDIVFNAPGLKKIALLADIQTGKNVFGAAAGGLGVYFNDLIDILTGPVYFFDGPLQPARKSWMWTVQLDVDIPLKAAAPAANPP